MHNVKYKICKYTMQNNANVKYATAQCKKKLKIQMQNMQMHN